VTFHGRTQCLLDWAKELGFNYVTLHDRLKYGWSLEDAFTVPISLGRPKRPRSTAVSRKESLVKFHAAKSIGRDQPAGTMIGTLGTNAGNCGG
jgi:hypothetical protein